MNGPRDKPDRIGPESDGPRGASGGTLMVESVPKEDAMTTPAANPEAHHHEDALDHLEDEIKALEGVTRWGRPLRIATLVIVLLGIAGAIAYFVTSPPQITSARFSYVPTTGSPIEVAEPKGAKLDDPPTRFAWEQVTGRLQYIVRIYVKGATTPVIERMVTSASLELTPDERAKLQHGNTFVWTVVAQGKDGSTIGAGQSSFKVR